MSSTEKALMSYYKKQIKKPRSSKPRSKPEKIVEKDVLNFCDKMGFLISVVESKAVYQVKAGRYMTGQASPGFSDLVGCDKMGNALFIELKAKGRLSTLRPSQHNFLIERIRSRAFSVVDSTERLSRIYSQWILLKRECPHDAMLFLLDELPAPKGIDTDDETELF